jgi:hypothetical protein
MPRLLVSLTLVAASLGLAGCAALPTVISGIASALSAASWIDRQLERERGQRPAAADPQAPQDALADAYRQGIRDALAQVRRSGGLAVAAGTEPPRITWVGPLMEEVWVPAQIVGGVLIPAHRQWVVVRPGYWQVGGQPLTVNTAAPAAPPAVAPASRWR